MNGEATTKDWEDRRGWAALFRNKKKTLEKHPDYAGVCVLETGQKVSVALWKRRTRNGDVFLSVRIQPFQDRHPQPAAKLSGISDEEL
jgi:uncharacterized protein (DUF736 family)